MSENNTTSNASTPSAAPATPAASGEAPKDGGQSTQPGTPSTPANGAAPESAKAGAQTGADAASTATGADATGSQGDEGELSATEKEVLALSREKARLRSEANKNKEKLSKAEKLEKAEGLIKSGDYVAALEALGLDPDDFYIKSTDQIVKREKKVVDPVEAAKAAAKEVLDEAEKNREKVANEKADKAWLTNVDRVLDADYDKYPDLARALATGRVTRDDMLQYAYACVEAKQDSSPGAIAKRFQDHLAPKKKVSAAAPPAGNGASAPAAAPATPAASVGAPPAATNNAPPTAPNEDTGSIEENFRRAMAKAGYGLPAYY